MRAGSLLAVALLISPSAALALLALPPALAAVSDSQVVIAVIDTGINPYHREFLDASRTAHPSTYIAGYPPEALGLDLCLSLEPASPCAELRGAVQRDLPKWQGVEQTRRLADAWGPLYWFPGTRVIGAVSLGEADDDYVAPLRIFDDQGHGTAVASLAAGRTAGLCPECLLVIVEGPGDEALAWAAAQPWIDIVSNSWGWQMNLGWPPPPLGTSNALPSRALVEQGKTVVFSAGNGPGFDTLPGVTDLGEYMLPGETTYTSEYTGPDWVITVGAVDPENGQPIAGTARPVDVAAAGIDVLAADGRFRSGTSPFSGTSAAAPLVAGAFGHVLLQSRRALGDAREGPRPGEVVAQGVAPASAVAGPLGDGVLTRAELQRALYATARPCAAAPMQGCEGARAPWPFPGRAWGWTLPTPPVAYPLMVGHGAITSATRDDAVRAVLGLDVPAPKPEAELWARSDSVLRQRLWGFWEHGASLPGLLD